MHATTDACHSPHPQHGAAPEAYDLLSAIRFVRPEELRLLLAAAEAEAEGGQALEPAEAATLLLKTVAWSRADCLEVCRVGMGRGVVTASLPLGQPEGHLPATVPNRSARPDSAWRSDMHWAVLDCAVETLPLAVVLMQSCSTALSTLPPTPGPRCCWPTG